MQSCTGQSCALHNHCTSQLHRSQDDATSPPSSAYLLSSSVHYTANFTASYQVLVTAYYTTTSIISAPLDCNNNCNPDLPIPTPATHSFHNSTNSHSYNSCNCNLRLAQASVALTPFVIPVPLKSTSAFNSSIIPLSPSL